MKKINYTLSIIILFAFACTISYAQSPSVEVKTDATHITVGDKINYFIEASIPKDASLQWATFPDSFNQLEIVEKGKIDTVASADQINYKQKLWVTGFDSGAFMIPSFRFVANHKDRSQILFSDSILIHVSTVAVDTTQPYKDIKNIITVKKTWRDYIWWIVGGLAALVFLVLLIRYFIKRKPASQPEPKIPAETLYQKTTRLLDELEAKKLWQGGNIKAYYIELTDILRNYIEERFQTQAMELTTDELLNKSHEHKEMSKHYDDLSQILHTADLAKFAKAQPLPYEHTETMALIRKFVHATKLAIVENKQNSPAS